MSADDRHDGAEEMLLQRMQTADPARTLAPADSDMTHLMEAVMSTNPVETKSHSRRWVPAIAAAAAVAVLGGTAYAVMDDRDPAHSPTTTVASLAMPASSGGTSMSSCLPFDAKYLRDMPVALSGTATEVGDDGVTLDVDHWYAGGDADVVHLANYDANTVSLDGLSFEKGSRYLITATKGTVNLCGFSGLWSEDLASAFDQAFSS